MVEELTNKQFNDFISEGVILIDFYADWCMPCVMMGPIVEEVADNLKGKAKIGKLNVEDNQELAKKYEVSSIPNFVLFKDGKPAERFVGRMTAEELQSKIESHL